MTETLLLGAPVDGSDFAAAYESRPRRQPSPKLRGPGPRAQNPKPQDDEGSLLSLSHSKLPAAYFTMPGHREQHLAVRNLGRHTLEKLGRFLGLPWLNLGSSWKTILNASSCKTGGQRFGL